MYCQVGMSRDPPAAVGLRCQLVNCNDTASQTAKINAPLLFTLKRGTKGESASRALSPNMMDDGHVIKVSRWGINSKSHSGTFTTYINYKSHITPDNPTGNPNIFDAYPHGEPPI